MAFKDSILCMPNIVWHSKILFGVCLLSYGILRFHLVYAYYRMAFGDSIWCMNNIVWQLKIPFGVCLTSHGIKRFHLVYNIQQICGVISHTLRGAWRAPVKL